MTTRSRYAMMAGSVDFLESFWGRVDERGADDCWPWKGNRARHGYGSCKLRRTASNASRIAWMLTNGADPGPLDVCHRCDNPPCCNPAHLFAGTRSDNMQDAKAKGRTEPKPAARCRRGHPMVGDNIVHGGKNGKRACRACRLIRTRSQREKLNADARVRWLSYRERAKVLRRERRRLRDVVQEKAS